MPTATIEVTPSKKLIQEMAKQTGPCLSVFFHLGDAITSRKLRIDALLHAAPASLAAPVRKKIEERIDVAASGAIAVYAAGDKLWAFEVSGTGPDFAENGNSFNVSPLVSELSQCHEFYMLAISQKHTRLLHCTLKESTEVSLSADFPSNFHDFNTHRDEQTKNHSQGGKMGTGHSQGGNSVAFGSSDAADKKGEYLHNFLNEIDKQVQHFLADKHLPLIVAGVDYEVALYHKVSEYPLLVAGGVIGSPDGLNKGGELHTRALEVLKTYNDSRNERVLATYARAAGHRVSVDLGNIAASAWDGRVLNLFVSMDAKRFGHFDEAAHAIVESDSGENLISWTMLETIKHGGDVVLLPRDSMPNQAEIAAYLRY